MKKMVLQKLGLLLAERPLSFCLKKHIILKYMESLNLVRFTYSQILDRVLSELVNNFQPDQTIEVRKKMLALAEEWNKYESQVIEELEKYPPYKFTPQSVKCYVVKNLPYTGISDPLIIKIAEDFELFIATLIHELVHISISQEENNLVTRIRKEFPETPDFRTQLHVVVNFIEYQILKKLFDKEKLDKIMNRELSLVGLKKAWEIVLTNEDKIGDIVTILK